MGINKEFLNSCEKAVLHKAGAKQSISPGTIGRRWIPSGGLKKHNEKIHRESKFADDHKNLPFSFSKPRKPRGIPTFVVCNNCGYIIRATSVTVGLICPSCNKFSSVTKVKVGDQ